MFLQHLFTQWVKTVGPSSVLEHIQYQGLITFEPRILNLEPINLGLTLLRRQTLPAYPNPQRSPALCNDPGSPGNE